jgi:hypothetical protein
MARVVLPLLGVEARGKVGNAIVFMPIPHATNGLTSVRVWTIPKNPQSETQGDVRLRMKAIGHGISNVLSTGTLATQIKAVTPATQIWNAYFVKQVMGDAFANIDASLTAWDTAANSVAWDSIAASLGVEDKDISYASIDPITAGEICFCLGRAAYDLGLAIAPDDAQSLTSDNVASFGAAMAA